MARSLLTRLRIRRHAAWLIAPETLPRAGNLHYFGRRPYGELPDFLAGWDVCLLPFARNDATRFLSPTRTLEYMAARKPIVTTPIATWSTSTPISCTVRVRGCSAAADRRHAAASTASAVMRLGFRAS